MGADDHTKQAFELWHQCNKEDRRILLDKLLAYKRRKVMTEKLFRILVVVLLAVIALSQFLPGDEPEPANTQELSQACSEAIESAKQLVSAEDERMETLLNQYDDLVYSRASNINQQILFANESLFAASALQIQLQHALLDVLASCD